MKKLFAVLFLILAVWTLGACADSRTETTPAETETSDAVNLSAFTAMGLDGQMYSGEIFRGKKLTVLNVWGTFCGPCIREMPALEALSRAYGDEIQLIGIPIDITDGNYSVLPNKRSEAEAILSETGARYLQILPSRSLDDLFLSEIQVLPTTIFVDENGRMLDEPYYGSRDYAGWKRVIDAYLEVLP